MPPPYGKHRYSLSCAHTTFCINIIYDKYNLYYITISYAIVILYSLSFTVTLRKGIVTCHLSMANASLCTGYIVYSINNY